MILVDKIFILYTALVRSFFLQEKLKGQCNEYCCKQATFGYIYTCDTVKLTTVQTV